MHSASLTHLIPDIPFPFCQALQVPAGPWLSRNLSGHTQEEYTGTKMPVLHAVSGYALLLQFQGHWQIPSWPGPSTGFIIEIDQLINMGKGRKTIWALFTHSDLVGVPYAAPGPWRNMCPARVCLCLLWKLPRAHTYKSVREPLVISNSSTGCTERRLGRAKAI